MLRAGEWVAHPAYGRGIVEEVFSSQGKLTLRVKSMFGRWTAPANECSQATAPPEAPNVSEAGCNVESDRDKSAQVCNDGDVENGDSEGTTDEYSESAAIHVAQENGSAEIAEPSAGDAPHCGDSELRARQAILALRLGQMHESSVLSLSVGTNALQQVLRREIGGVAEGGARFIVLDGAWGGGKTHALSILTALARRERMVVMSAVMDGESVSLAKPVTTVEALMLSLRMPDMDSSFGLVGIMSQFSAPKAIAALKASGANLLADVALKLPPDALIEPEWAQSVEDYLALASTASQTKTRLWIKHCMVEALPNLRPTRLVDHVQGAISYLVQWSRGVNAIGYGGLLIILDELDVEYGMHAGKKTLAADKHRVRRREFLGALKDLRGERAPLLVAFASAPAVSYGGDEEDDAVQDVRACLGGLEKHIRVPELGRDELELLFNRVVAAYDEAYPRRPVAECAEKSAMFKMLYEAYEKQISNRHPRWFLRAALELCDQRPCAPLHDVHGGAS